MVCRRGRIARPERLVLLTSAVGAEVGFDIPLTAIGADPAGIGGRLLCAAVGTEIGGNARLTASGTIPGGRFLRLLCATVGAELVSLSGGNATLNANNCLVVHFASAITTIHSMSS